MFVIRIGFNGAYPCIHSGNFAHNRGAGIMTIQCATIAELVAVCAGLVREGVTFEARTSSMSVDLTGGF